MGKDKVVAAGSGVRHEQPAGASGPNGIHGVTGRALRDLIEQPLPIALQENIKFVIDTSRRLAKRSAVIVRAKT